MSDSHLDDEEVSAALDGEASEEGCSHIAGCSLCQGRLDEFRRVSGVLAAAGPPTPAAARDEAVEAALAAPRGAIEHLRRRGAAEHLGRRPAGVLRPAAAALLVVAVAGAVVASVALSRGGNSSRVSTGALAGHPHPGAVASTQPPTGAKAAQLMPATSGGLGAFSTSAGVASALRQNAAHPPSVSLLPATSPPCATDAAAAAGLPPQAVAVVVAPLTYKGVAAVAYAYAGGVAVLEKGTGASCSTLAVIDY